MRSPALALLVVVLLLTTLPACDADKNVYGPAQVVVTPPPSGNPPGNTPMATFQQDSETTTHGVGIRAVIYTGDDLWLYATALWATHPLGGNQHPTSADVLLRIDPQANAEVLQLDTLGSWCGFETASVTPTGTPGEWRIQRSSLAEDCTCADPWSDWGRGTHFGLGGVRLKIHTPGTWRVEVAPASATPVCECEQGCFGDLAYFGGMLAVPTP